MMAKEDEIVTRVQLAEALAKSTALVEEQGKLIAELRAQPAATVDPIQLEILKALKELRESTPRQSPTAFYTGPKVETKPYRGWAKALQKCQVSHPGEKPGQIAVHVHEEGEVFGIDVEALWTDDPYVAVTITGYEDQEQMKPITVANKDAPPQADFRFRRQVELEEKPTLRRASEY
ncbi:MAG: hypothetical protein JWO52_7842 [Gammaproteobacteria bacterium]|nr:hypothetical protein [Gammaproteobacteria bacterium]